MIISYWRDFYGCSASIRNTSNGSKLTIRTPSGELIKQKTYKTHRGAMIAMGKSSDGWHFISQKSSGKIRIKL